MQTCRVQLMRSLDYLLQNLQEAGHLGLIGHIETRQWQASGWSRWSEVWSDVECRVPLLKFKFLTVSFPCEPSSSIWYLHAFRTGNSPLEIMFVHASHTACWKYEVWRPHRVSAQDFSFWFKILGILHELFWGRRRMWFRIVIVIRKAMRHGLSHTCYTRCAGGIQDVFAS